MFEADDHVPRLEASLAYLPYEIEVHHLDFSGNQQRVAPAVNKDGVLIFER